MLAIHSVDGITLSELVACDLQFGISNLSHKQYPILCFINLLRGTVSHLRRRKGYLIMATSGIIKGEIKRQIKINSSGMLLPSLSFIFFLFY